jgi:ribosomal protein S18 acetylase RimI-like enzyme
VTRFRPFRNDDPPVLVDLWNRGLPEYGVACPLSAHEFDTLVIGKLHFEAAGLVVAERDGTVVGFAHAGFGPAQPAGPTHQLDLELGTVAVLVLEPHLDDPELERGLILAAERYLRRRGASVFYAGGQAPLNPFYWGLYGGSEFSGVLATDQAFNRAVERAGYQPAATSVLLEADLSRPDVRDPRAALLRRQTRLEVTEDALLVRWWDALAIGLFHPTTFQLLDRSSGRVLARATTWDMTGFERIDGRIRIGLVAVEVETEHRRKGYGRFLVAEILRYAREQSAEAVSVQTAATNAPALALYDALGFAPVETATLFRLPAELASRSLDES